MASRILHDNSAALNRWVSAQSETCLLSFSTGKDSIAAALECRRHFKRVVFFYCYLIPGLSFVEKSLAYFERVFETTIIRFPHPFLYRLLNNLVFQPPQNCAIIERADLPTFDYSDVYRIIKEDCGLPQDTWTATGVRAVDNPLRMITVKQSGAYNPALRTFMCIFDWNKARVLEEIRAAGVGLPIDYKVFGRSFDGLDFRFLAPLREHFPDDYKKVLELFPMADLELFRRGCEHGTL